MKAIPTEEKKPSFYYFIATSLFWPESVSIFLQQCFLWIANLQYILILVNIQLNNIALGREDILAYWLHKASEWLLLKDIVEMRSYSHLIEFLFILIWIYFILLFGIIAIIIIRSVLKQRLSMAEKLYTYYLSQFHISIGFWIASTLLLKSTSSDSLEIWNGNNISQNTALVGFHIFLVIFFYIIGFVVSCLSYNPFYSASLLSAHSPFDQILLFVSKAIILPIISLQNIPNTNSLWAIVIACLVISLLRYFYLTVGFPYFSDSPLKLCMTSAACIFMLSCASFIGLILQSKRTETLTNIVYIEVFLAILITKCCDSHLNYIIRKALNKETRSLKTERQVFQKLFALSYIYKKLKVPLVRHRKFDLQFLTVSGISCNTNAPSIQSPTDQSQAPMSLKSIPNSENEMSYEDTKQRLELEVLLNSTRQIKYNNTLKAILAHYLINLNLNLPMAITYLLEVSKSSSFQRVISTHLLYTLEQKIQQSYANLENDTINVKEFIDFRKISHQFTTMISSVTKMFIKFWDNYSSHHPEISALFSLSQKIEKADEIIRRMWTRDIEPHIQFASSLVHIYTCYLSYLRSASETAETLTTKYEKFSLIKNRANNQGSSLIEENLISPSNIILNVSLSKESFGKIIEVSSNIDDQLGWNQEDLIGKNINTLMLPGIKDRYTRLMLKTLEANSERSILNQKYDIFVQTKSGNVKAVYLYQALYPYIKNELTYVIILRVREHKGQQIVVNEEGIVEGITREIAQNLDLTKTKQISIEDCGENVENYNMYALNGKLKTPALLDLTPKQFNFSSLKQGTSKSLTKKNQKKFTIEDKEILLDFSNLIPDIGTKSTLESTRYVTVVTYESYFGVPFYIFDVKEGFSKSRGLLRLHLPSSKRVNEKLLSEIEEDAKDIIPNEQDNEDGMLRLDHRLTSMQSQRGLLSPIAAQASLLLFREESAGYNNAKAMSNRLVEPSFDILEEDDFMEEKLSDHRIKTLNRMKTMMREVEVSSTQAGSSIDHRVEFEQAIYTVPNENSGRIFPFLALFYSLLCGCLLIVFQVENSKTLINIGDDTLIASNWTRQLVGLVTLDHWVLRITMPEAGLFKDNRFAWFGGGGSLKKGNAVRFNTTINQITPVTFGLRESMSEIDGSFRKRFFQKIPVYKRDMNNNIFTNRQANTFDIVNEVISAADSIVWANQSKIYGNTSFVAFIGDNTLNDLLVFGENIVNIVLEDIDQKMNHLKYLIIYFTAVAIFMSVLLLGFGSVIIRNFAKDRDKFLDIFLRLDIKQIRHHLSLVSNFGQLLENNMEDINKFKKLAPLSQLNQKNTSTEDYKVMRAKSASKKGINRSLVKISLIAVLVNIILFFGFILEFSILSNKNTTLQDKLNLIVECDLIQYHSLLLFYQTHLYLGFNGTSRVRNLPIGQSWDISYNVVNQRLAKFITLAQVNQQPGGNQQIADLLTGDLCQLLPTMGPLAANYCPIGLHGLVRKGLIEVAGALVTTFQTVKQAFDASNRAKTDQYNGLNTFGLVESEPIATNYWFPGYSAISDIVRNQLIATSDTFGQSSGMVFIVWGICYIIVGSIGWWLIGRMYDKHRVAWKKMVRMIPSSVVVNNKMIKGYLSKNTNTMHPAFFR